MADDKQAFQVVLPDGQCVATLGITFNTMSGDYRRNYHDIANHNFCEGDNGFGISTGRLINSGFHARGAESG